MSRKRKKGTDYLKRFFSTKVACPLLSQIHQNLHLKYPIKLYHLLQNNDELKHLSF